MQTASEQIFPQSTSVLQEPNSTLKERPHEVVVVNTSMNESNISNDESKGLQNSNHSEIFNSLNLSLNQIPLLAASPINADTKPKDQEVTSEVKPEVINPDQTKAEETETKKIDAMDIDIKDEKIIPEQSKIEEKKDQKMDVDVKEEKIIPEQPKVEEKKDQKMDVDIKNEKNISEEPKSEDTKEQQTEVKTASAKRPFMIIEQFLPESRQTVKPFICEECHGIVNIPYLYEQKFHCKSCLESLGSDLLRSAIYVQPIHQTIDKEKLYCSNKEVNCNWIGSPKDLQEHLENQCEKQIINCPNEGCENKFFRESLNGHLIECPFRIINCPDCNEKIKSNSLDSHSLVCPEFKIPCTQNCGEKIKRKELGSHITNSCSNTLLDCQYAKYGCQHPPVKRREYSQKMESLMSEHMKLVTSYFEKMEKHIVETCENTNKKIEQNRKSLDESYKELQNKNEQKQKDLEAKIDLKIEDMEKRNSYHNAKCLENYDQCYSKIVLICDTIGLEKEYLGKKRERDENKGNEHTCEGNSDKGFCYDKKNDGNISKSGSEFSGLNLKEDEENLDINRKQKKTPCNKRRKGN